MIDRSTNVGAALRKRQRGFLLNPYRFAPAGGATDPYYSSVSALLHGDGTNGSTTFLDSGPNSLTFTPYGDAQVSTAQSKFGGASILLDGTGDYLLTPDATAFDFGSGDFTIELWIYANAWGTTSSVLSKRPNGTSYGPFNLAQDTNGKFYALTSTNGTTWVNTSQTFALSLHTWYHLAMCRNGTSCRTFVNGLVAIGYSMSGTVISTSAAVAVGSYADGSVPFNGYIDDVRITKGVARYTSDFAAPTAAFPDS